MDPIKIRQDLLHNQEEVHDYMRDLRAWTDQIKKKDQSLLNSKAGGEATCDTGKGSKVSKKPQARAASGSSKDASAPRIKMSRKSEPSEEGMRLKEAGNESLKNQKYDDAIKHYTAAMELDPTYAILPANRGMAFLKQNLFEKAEDDCSRAISLDPQYIKAYLRRGSARLELGKLQLAREDYQEVLKLEPHNRQAKASLERICLEETKQSRVQSAQSQPGEPAEGKSAQTTTKPPHLRSKKPLKKIEVVEVRNDEELRRFIEQETASGGDGAPDVRASESSQSPPKRKEAEEEAANQSAQQEQGETQATKAAVPASEAGKVTTVLPPPPRTSYQFIKDWKALRANGDMRRRYLLQIPPESYGVVFRQALEESTLVEILRVVGSLPAADVCAHLRELSRLQRIDVLVMFMAEEDRAMLRRLLARCAEDGQDMSDVKRRLGV